MIGMNTKRLLAAFLMVGGSVCAGPAIGQNVADGVEAVDLFDAEARPGEAPKVVIGAGGVTITAKDTDITLVLRILSMQSKRNIIASRNVSGTVSANLYDVDFYEALDAILQPNGFGYQEKGNFIYVKTLEEIRAEENANRKKMHKLVRLNYLSSADASAYVSPLLSGEGSISVSPDAAAGFQPSMGDGGSNTSAHADTLIIVDYEENIEAIAGLITQLDVQPKQVQLDATILQITLTERTALGVDFSVYGDIGIDDITTPLGAVDNLISRTGSGGVGSLNSGQAVTTSAGNTVAGQSGVKIGFLGSDASLFIRALDSVNDTSVLAAPKALVLNRQKVELLVGQRLGYLSTTVTETSETQTVEFLDVGVQLTARPFISDDDRIRMELRASLSDGNTDRVVDGSVIPTETTQEIVTNVIMRNGQTVVLGGLFKEDTGSNVSQLPGIGHVPVLGLLGKGQDDSVDRTEVVFLIKSTIMKDEVLGSIGKEVEQMTRDSVVGSRANLLPWSRTKMTAAHMTKARTFLDEGDQKKALWHVNLALHLDPTMVDAMKLKRDLTGETFYYHNRSRLDRVIDSMIDEQTDTIAPVQPSDPATKDLEELDDSMSGADLSTEDLSAALTETSSEEAAVVGQSAEAAPATPAADSAAELDEIAAAIAAFDAQNPIETVDAESATGDVEVMEVEMAETTEAEAVTAEQPITVDVLEPVTMFDDVEGDGHWDDSVSEQVTEVSVELDDTK